MREKDVVFEFPIYRVTSTQFGKEVSNKMIALAGHSDYESLSHFHKCIMHIYSYNWKYNDIVGYVVVHLMQNESIGFDLYWTDKRKICRNGRHKIEYKYYFNGMYIPINSKTNYSGMGDLILANINEITKGKEFKNRYIDTKYFEKIKDTFDWKLFISKCMSQ